MLPLLRQGMRASSFLASRPGFYQVLEEEAAGVVYGKRNSRGGTPHPCWKTSAAQRIVTGWPRPRAGSGCSLEPGAAQTDEGRAGFPYSPKPLKTGPESPISRT
jgi:hypothetical protein